MKNYFQRAKKWLLKEKYNGRECLAYFKDIERIKKGEPLDYIIGFRKFLNCHIDLSLKPLIPREETEYWVEKTISEIKNQYCLKPLKFLDVFSGSGCIGIAFLKHLRNANVVFAEKNYKFIEQIKINLKINRISKRRYQIIQSDIFSNIKGRFDFVFANPPYIATKNKIKIQKSVLKYEPKIALFGGKDGLFYIKKFLKKAKLYLKKEGIIFMEFDSPQKNKIEILLKKLNYLNYSFYKDQFNRFRYLKIVVF